MQRWMWLVVLVGAAWVATSMIVDGAVLLGVVIAAAGLAFSWYLSPWRGGRSLRHQEVMAMAESDREVVVYWRPGCGFCARLRSALGEAADRAHWVNIWQDDEAAEFVRSVNDGNETVPTVVIDGAPHTNPDPEVVRERLDRVAG